MEDLTKLKELVIQEANNLRANATKEELERLDFDKLDSNDSQCCIYGQMTGCCFSITSHFLLAKCAIPYTFSLMEFDESTQDRFSSLYHAERVSFSAIERYIFLPSAKNRTLISFLKGETETLNVEDL